MTAALSLADVGNWSVNLASDVPLYGQQTTLNVIGVTLGRPSKRNSFEQSAPWCCTSHSAVVARLMVVVRFSYRGERHEPDKSDWHVAPVQASLSNFAGWFELRSAKSERRHFARHRHVARQRAIQAGDAVLVSLKYPMPARQDGPIAVSCTEKYSCPHCNWHDLIAERSNGNSRRRRLFIAA